jgi:hypothetical protein
MIFMIIAGVVLFFPVAFIVDGLITSDSVPPPPPPCSATDCRYVRIMANGETCASSGHSDVTSLAECEAAFADQDHADKTSSSEHAVSTQDYSFRPKGCYSLAFSDHSGYFGRRFNTHASGRGEGTSVVDDDEQYVLCRAEPEGGNGLSASDSDSDSDN